MVKLQKLLRAALPATRRDVAAALSILGIIGHEAPYLAEGYYRNLEPGIYIPGLGGFRHSDTVRITEDGCASLTHAPETLEELTIPL